MSWQRSHSLNNHEPGILVFEEVGYKLELVILRQLMSCIRLHAMLSQLKSESSQLGIPWERK